MRIVEIQFPGDRHIYLHRSTDKTFHVVNPCGISRKAFSPSLKEGKNHANCAVKTVMKRGRDEMGRGLLFSKGEQPSNCRNVTLNVRVHQEPQTVAISDFYSTKF